eukprot:TRINITY_DN23472_c0_g1_i1.p1 TRINITY_DN23472_c0_g1~~TRINITY_DN23472_c0_g1_i1.p1  ORF type:complete len:426 (+),score=132.67 TRINITY_DN23472_c0_g1_i1:47-1279(+)
MRFSTTAVCFVTPCALIYAQRLGVFHDDVNFLTVLFPVYFMCNLLRVLWNDCHECGILSPPKALPMLICDGPSSPTDSTCTIEDEVQREEGERGEIMATYFQETMCLRSSFKEARKHTKALDLLRSAMRTFASNRSRTDAALTIQRFGRAHIARRTAAKLQRRARFATLATAVFRVVYALASVSLAYVAYDRLPAAQDYGFSQVSTYLLPALALSVCGAWRLACRSSPDHDASPPSAVVKRYIDYYRKAWLVRCKTECLYPVLVGCAVVGGLVAVAAYMRSLLPTGWNVLAKLLEFMGVGPLLEFSIAVVFVLYPAWALLRPLLSQAMASACTVQPEYTDYRRASLMGDVYEIVKGATPEERAEVLQWHTLMNSVPNMRGMGQQQQQPGMVHPSHVRHHMLLPAHAQRLQ